MARGALPPDLLPYLPGATAATWVAIAPLLPASAYLAGGTGLTVHLHHRVSRDLDFMLAEDEDLEALAARLEGVGTLAVTHLDEGTLNGVLDETRVQFLRAADQVMLRPTTTVAGIPVASVEDIAAMKLKVVLDRGELRDYFDLMEIDRRDAVPMEEALALLVRRYDLKDVDRHISMVVRSLGYLDDVADDPALPASRAGIESYWATRQPTLVAHLSRM